jgi:hypothetical protein
MPLAHSPAHLDIDIGAGDGPITCNTEHLHSKPRTDTHERSHLDPGTKREPIPVPIPTSAFHAGPPLLSPTPTRSSSMDAALPPAYTPLALGLERPNAPVGGLSSCSPWSPPHRTPVEVLERYILQPPRGRSSFHRLCMLNPGCWGRSKGESGDRQSWKWLLYRRMREASLARVDMYMALGRGHPARRES